jgi:hypothetical protein
MSSLLFHAHSVFLLLAFSVISHPTTCQKKKSWTRKTVRGVHVFVKILQDSSAQTPGKVSSCLGEVSVPECFFWLDGKKGSFFCIGSGKDSWIWSYKY